MQKTGAPNSEPDTSKPLHTGALVHKSVFGSSETPHILSATPNVMGLLRALWRRRYLALSLGILSAVIGVSAVWLLQLPGYMVRTTMQVAPSPPHILNGGVDNSGMDFGNYQRIQVASVKSRLVFNKALRDPKVAALPMLRAQSEPLDFLEREIQADFNVAPTILRIYMKGNSPDEMVTIVDSVREAYFSEFVRKEADTRDKRLDKLRKLMREYLSSLEEQRKTMAQMAGELGSDHTSTLVLMHEVAIKQLSEVQKELNDVQTDTRKTQMELFAEKARASSVPDAEIPGWALDEWISQDPRVLLLNSELSRRQADMAQIKETARNPDQEPAYKRAVAALEVTKSSLAARREELRPEIASKAREKLESQSKAALAMLEEKLFRLQTFDTQLKQQAEEMTKSNKSFSRDVMSLEYLRDEITQTDAMAKRISAQIESMEVEKGAPDRITPFEESVVVKDPDSRGKKMAMAGFGSFFLVVFGVAFLEFRLRRVNNIEDVVSGLKFRLLGALPLMKDNAKPGDKPTAPFERPDPQNILNESIDSARTMLWYLANAESLRVVTVTSAVGGEGKTFLSSHLAVSLARSGRKTLLIDGDLRRPSIHRLFGMSIGPGFGEMIRGEIPVSQAIRPGPVENLHVLTAGRNVNRMLQNLPPNKLDMLLMQLREAYDFVLVDTAPILPVADTLLIAQHTDGVLFSILRDVSRLPSVYAAYERLSLLKVRVLGAVVSGDQIAGYDSRYGYYGESVPEVQSPEADAPEMSAAEKVQ